MMLWSQTELDLNPDSFLHLLCDPKHTNYFIIIFLILVILKPNLIPEDFLQAVINLLISIL